MLTEPRGGGIPPGRSPEERRADTHKIVVLKGLFSNAAFPFIDAAFTRIAAANQFDPRETEEFVMMESESFIEAAFYDWYNRLHSQVSHGGPVLLDRRLMPTIPHPETGYSFLDTLGAEHPEHDRNACWEIMSAFARLVCKGQERVDLGHDMIVEKAPYQLYRVSIQKRQPQ